MNQKKILIVDDDLDLQRSLQILLESKGFFIKTASNKQEGLPILLSFKPDLLILDIMMETTLEGYGMLHELKKDNELKKIPVIMLTGMADELGVNFRSAVEDPDMLPNVVFMDKPVEHTELISEIEKLINP